MNEKEIREIYPPRKCESQIEFDRLMSALHEAQAHANHPLLDRESELMQQRTLLLQQRQAINIQLEAIKVERIQLDARRRQNNRAFHDVKHELIMLNPKEELAKRGSECG